MLSDIKYRQFFIHEEKICYEEGNEIEFKDCTWPLSQEKEDILRKTICGFLNSKGGRLYIGIREYKQSSNSDTKVVGIKLNPKEKDEMALKIVNLTCGITPSIRATDKVRIHFVPIIRGNGEWIENFWVVKVIVHQGDVQKLYGIKNLKENANLLFYERLDRQVILLKEEEYIDRLNQILTGSLREKINSSDFEDHKRYKAVSSRR